MTNESKADSYFVKTDLSERKCKTGGIVIEKKGIHPQLLGAVKHHRPRPENEQKERQFSNE